MFVTYKGIFEIILRKIEAYVLRNFTLVVHSDAFFTPKMRQGEKSHKRTFILL